MDLSKVSGATEEIARRGIARAFGADSKDGSKLQSLRAYGSDFDITINRGDLK